MEFMKLDVRVRDGMLQLIKGLELDSRHGKKILHKQVNKNLFVGTGQSERQTNNL
jgi:hypothetical protein